MEWPGSLWFNLAFSLILGVIYTSILLGPGALNPRNLRWMAGDAAIPHIAWEMFRQDPYWHWPLCYTDRLGDPIAHMSYRRGSPR